MRQQQPGNADPTSNVTVLENATPSADWNDRNASSDPLDLSANDEQIWHDLHSWLLSLVSSWVYSSGVIAWQGQYREIAEEITQETMMRTFNYVQRSERGEVAPVVSLKSLSKTIAHNHFHDRRRKDYRLVHAQDTSLHDTNKTDPGEHIDPSQIAIDRLVFRAAIIHAAQIVARFPRRQRFALLTDLANTADFANQPTLLEQAFSDAGLCLRDYHQPLPENQVERGRYAALLCIAYKRLRNTIQV